MSSKEARLREWSRPMGVKWGVATHTRATMGDMAQVCE
jgi:hypothetical protein